MSNFGSSDISKCTGQDCEKKDKCHRYLAPIEPLWQSYLMPTIVKGKCKDYWPVRKENFKINTNPTCWGPPKKLNLRRSK